MIKLFFLFILTIFQDNFVRIGTFFGALVGFWHTYFFHENLLSKIFIFGFIGWGFGLYLGNFFSENRHLSKKKLRLFKGGKK